MILSPEDAAQFGEGYSHKLADEEHGYLPGADNMFETPRSPEFGRVHVEMFGHGLHDAVGRDDGLGSAFRMAQDMFEILGSYIAIEQFRIGENLMRIP